MKEYIDRIRVSAQKYVSKDEILKICDLLDEYSKFTKENNEVYKLHEKSGLMVSNMGNIIYKGRPTKGNVGKNGYARKAGYRIHTLVAETFIPNPQGKSEVNHKNSNRADNRAENLEWVTRSENIQHAYDKGNLVAPKTAYKARPVKCVETGQEYRSIWQAKKDHKITTVAMSVIKNKKVFSQKEQKKVLFQYIYP